MAQSVTKATNLKSQIQSKAQEAVTSMQQKTASSTEATQAWSTTTPAISETPKVASTAKAMPSIQRPEITPVNIATPTITTPSSTDLFSKPTASIRKAITPDIIDDNNVDTPEAADILAKSYDNVPDSTKEIVWDLIRDNWIKFLKKIYGNAIQENKATRTVNNLFSSATIDTARWLINTAQWRLDKASFSLLPESSTLMNMTLPFYSFYRDSLEEWIMNTKLGQETKAERDKIFKAIFDTTEERDQKLAQTTWYKEAKKTADKWAEQWNTILDAMQEWNWDIVATRVWETIWQMLPIVWTALLTKNPWITASTTYTLIFWDAYKRSLVDINNNPEFEWLTAEQKNNLATTMAQIEAWIETMWDVLELAPFMKGKFSIADMTGLKNVILRWFLNIEWSAVIEWWEEVFTEILQNIAKRAYWWSDSATAQELWELFADTWAIMQFVWLLWWIKWWINTYNRNKVKKVLEKEAENYDNFNDFESDATIAWIDKELIQEAWSDSKWLSAEQTASLEYDIDYVENQENKATELYNEQWTIESRLEELSKTPEENKEQISKLEKRLQEINSQLQDIDNNIKEYMEVYWQQETTEELPSQQEVQMPREEWGENLSKQTMRIVPDSEVKLEWLEKQITSEQQYKESTGGETPTQRYLNLIKTLNSKTTKYSNSFDWKEFKLKEDLIKELKNMSVEAWARLLSQYDAYSLKEVLGVADRTLKSMKQWRNTRIKQDQLAKLYEQLKMGIDLKNQMIDELKSLKDKTSKEEVEWISDYRLLTWIWDFASARSAFSREKTIYWKHLVWLKDVSIKQLEWKITDEVANKFSLMLAKASQILWIDFNKVIWDNDLTLTVWKKDNVEWFFNRDWTKESLTDILEELKRKWEDTSQYDNLAERTFKAWIYLATLDNVSVSEATATLAHEFMHMLDYRRVIDLWLKAYINEHSKISRKGTWISSKEADYILKWDKKWKTFNNPEDVNSEWKDNRDKYDELMAWTIDLPQMTYDDVTYANEMLYIYDPTEIFARYAEQYYLWKTDKEMFDEYSKRSWYWTEEKFKELIDDFEDLLQNEFADYQIEEWNRNYVDVMQKLMDFKYNQILASDKERLEDIKNSNPEMQKDAVNKMLAMQKKYVELSAELDELEWTISEEIKAEYATELDNLATNMWILEETLQDYTRFVDKKVPIENFEAADSALESENLEEDQQQIEDENAYFEEQEQMQDEMDEQIEEAWWIQNIDEWKDREKEFTEEERTQKKWERKRNLVESRDWIWDVAKDILTPTMSRIYNINRRVAWRLTQMETQSWMNIYRYTQRCQWFVDHMNTLKWTAKLEVTEALLNYWALASEQTEDTIEDYKREEVKKLREVLLRNWFKEKDINDMFSVLNDLWNRYKEAWLSISISDMYFPRVVKDYKWLIEYMSRVSWTKIEEKTKGDLMKDIQKIIDNDTYSDAEKERLIRNKLTTQFPSKIKINSKHSEERKLWLLSEWWAGIYAYYENPTVSLAHYITTMEYAIQRQLFLWWQAKDLWLDIDTINSSNEDSVSSIVEWLVERWEISSSQVNELQKCIIAVMDKKNTPRWIQRIKDLTYTMALTNYISAINQLEDIWVAIIENKWWLISSVKAIFSKAWIKYTDSWLESAYEMFRTNLWISNKLFAASWFNFTDRLGKKCFLNAAWTSMVKRAKNGRSRKYLVDRLTAMYWEKTANHIMEKVDAWDYMTNWQIDIDVLTDLLYQLWTTQPIYASAMPVAYLRSPNARWFYALSMFSIRQADHIIQSTKQTYKERWAAAAAVQAFWFVATRMFFGVLVWDLWDWLMWKWTEETWLWQWIDEWPEAASDKFLEDYLKAFSKLWMLSDYDKETFKKDWIWWVIANKMYPYIIQEAHKLRKSTERAFKNEDATELIPMLRDVPIIWKQVASWWNYFLEEATTQARPSSKKTWRPKATWSERPTSSSKSRPTS